MRKPPLDEVSDQAKKRLEMLCLPLKLTGKPAAAPRLTDLQTQVDKLREEIGWYKGRVETLVQQNKETKREHQQAIRALEEKHQQAIRALEEKHQQAIGALEEKHQQTVNKVQKVQWRDHSATRETSSLANVTG